jgi:mono/diheme cytochrome c family protein
MSLALLFSASAHALEPGAQRGLTFVSANCTPCHAVDKVSPSPLAIAPPFRTLHTKYPVENLAESLAEGIMTGHPTMPQFQLDPGQVGDVIAYLKVTFKGVPDMAAAPSGVCVQPRKTVKAPDEFLSKTNPLPASAGTIQAGKTLYLKTAQPVACALCHGEQGDGKGIMGAALVPPPRNFTCGSMMKDIPDGQLFWIIKNGSPETGMMSFVGLPDGQVWQVIQYIRSLAK